MFRTIDDFATMCAEESGATLKIFRALDERSITQAVMPERRTLGRLAWHITTTLQEMTSEAKLHVDGPKPDAPQPALADIVCHYETASRSLVDAVRREWSDTKLAEKVPMYGDEWSRGQVFAALLLHQAHHRGQMTVLMRQAGLVVPGIYGPAYEEWAAYNAPPQP